MGTTSGVPWEPHQPDLDPLALVDDRLMLRRVTGPPSIDRSVDKIRRGVAEFHERVPEKPDLTFTLDKSTLDRIRLGQLTMGDAVAGGIVHLTTGTAADVARFLTYFDTPFTTDC